MAALVRNEGREISMGTDLKSGVIILVFVVGMVSIAAGRIIYVDDDGPADFNAIQAAIDDPCTTDGDEIEVAPGTYNEAINFNGKAVSLYSSSGPEVTTIDGTGYIHVVQCGSGEDANTVLEGFTITGGHSNMYFGGGMYNGYFSSPTVTNCTFSGNAAYKGGGMYNDDSSSPTVTNCTFSGNSSNYKYGGGMYNFGSDPTVANCTFSGNSAYQGGGMYNDRNSPILTNCTFSGNSASGDGGGMYNYRSSPILTNCIISYNLAYGDPPPPPPPLPLPDSLSSSYDGTGGGMYNADSTPILTNCILWGNKALEGTQIHGGSSVTYSDVQGGWPGTGNINADPCMVLPGYWVDATDPNIIVEPNEPNAIWVDGDYHLRSQAGRWDPNSTTWIKDANTSPCIDTGDPNSDLIAELWPHGERINMGAFGGTPEASKSLTDAGSIADLNYDRQVDIRDMKLLIDKWPYENLLMPEDLSRDEIVNFVDFAIFCRILGLLVYNPNPTNFAMGVSFDADLGWMTTPYAESHDVYFGTSSPPPFACNQTSKTFDPGTMDPGTKYYWRIDEVCEYGTITGTVWSFTTMILPPTP
jgi:parallel beta-helix repeat protein